jgi:hypothetical protein
MSFETDFPSLKNYNQMPGSHIRWHKESDIEKHCRDVQNINKAWFKIIKKAKEMSNNTDDSRFASLADEMLYLFNKELEL